ncbi:hypothetical protein L7F22_062573 [Adiantum nelumboides]|nr:hypothetical protein [Adiantum nelumboides]
MAGIILEPGSKSEDQEKPARQIECKQIVDEISMIGVEKWIEEKFVDTLSDDLPSLDDDLLMLDADDEKLSEFENDKKYVIKPKVFYEFPNKNLVGQERYRSKRIGKSRGNKDKSMLLFKDKMGYLRLVKANNCVKDKVTGQFSKDKPCENNKKNKHEKDKNKTHEGWELRLGMTKTERKSEHHKLKQTLKDAWTTKMETDEDTNLLTSSFVIVNTLLVLFAISLGLTSKNELKAFPKVGRALKRRQASHHRNHQPHQIHEAMASNDSSSASHEVQPHAKQRQEGAIHPAEPILCVNNCGFYGFPQNHNLCSCCFKLRLASPALSSSASAKAQLEGATIAASSSSEPPSPAPPQKPSRCLACRKRVGLTGFKCRCGDVFCSSHRYSDQHQCPFDYKAAARQAIASSNPVVKADKITKL